MSKEFKKLEKENNRIREEIKLRLIDFAIPEKDINYLFIKIDELIDNELRTEEFCNE